VESQPQLPINASKTVLVVDDDKQVAELIQHTLSLEGYTVYSAHKGSEGLEIIRKQSPHLVLLDIHLPDKNGLEVLKEIKKIEPSINIIMISGTASIQLAVGSMKLGAYDYIEKPFEITELQIKVKHAFEKSELEQELTELKRELGEKYKLKSMIGGSHQMKKVFGAIEIAAKSHSNILITGESGTGKELVARAIHFNSPRKQDRFVAVDCGAIPVNLLESELYGHERGSFTGAVGMKIGKFEHAKKGTLFLDEIGDLPIEQQAKLLRTLQEREIQRIGGNQSIRVNARFICATNRNLEKLIKEGKFREDLYFRINVVPIHLPPLRERRDDIPALISYFTKKYAFDKKPLEISTNAMERLTQYSWPGNIRELENFIERTSLLKGENRNLEESDIKMIAVTSAEPGEKNLQTMEDAEKMMMENALKNHHGNISKASQSLQISRDTFYRKMKKYGIQV
jgi:DNA-binding NtrC family response regulator